MGLTESILYYDRGVREDFGDRVGKYARYRYQQYASKLEKRFLSDRHRYQYRVWRNQLGVDAAADPRELRYVDPTDVVKTTAFHPHFCWRKIGAVKGGDWDRNLTDLKDLFEDVWNGLVAHFRDGVAWGDTKIVQETLAGDRHWHHHRGEAVWEWCEHLDALYESIATNGYRPQREVLDMSFEEACASETVSIEDWMDDVRLDIGREGRLIRHDGRHRLWLAELQGIDQIPAIVVVRHREWQRLRDEIAGADDVGELSEDARRHLDHPDMIDVRGSLSLAVTEPPRA